MSKVPRAGLSPGFAPEPKLEKQAWTKTQPWRLVSMKLRARGVALGSEGEKMTFMVAK